MEQELQTAIGHTKTCIEAGNLEPRFHRFQVDGEEIVFISFANQKELACKYDDKETADFVYSGLLEKYTK